MYTPEKWPGENVKELEMARAAHGGEGGERLSDGIMGGYAARGWVGMLAGTLLMLTFVIPWGVYGNKPLWSWRLFLGGHAGHDRAMLIGAWVIGGILLAAGAARLGSLRTPIYLVAGAIGLALYLLGTRASPLPWHLFVPISTHFGGAIPTAVIVLATYLTVTGIRARGSSQSTALRWIQGIASVALAGAFLLSISGDVHKVRDSHFTGVWLWTAALGLAAAWLVLLGSWLAFRDSRERWPGTAAMAARRLVLLGLLVLFIRGMVMPVMRSSVLTAGLAPLNNQILLACISMVTIEGLIGVLGPCMTNRAAAGGPANAFRGWNVVAAGAGALVVVGGVALGASTWSTKTSSSAAASAKLTKAVPGTGDWPQWCGAPDRNMVSNERGLPMEFDGLLTSQKKSGLANVKWVVRLSNQTLGSPVVAGGKVFIGGSGENHSGLLWCFSEADGKFLWRMQSPYVYRLDEDSFGICATPTVEGDRLYLLGHLGDVLCLSVDGMLHGNHGPFTDEAKYFATNQRCTKSVVAPDGSRILEWTPGEPATLTPTDADILWRFDMLREVNAWPFNAFNAAIIVRGDRLYVATCSTMSRSDGGTTSKKVLAWKAQYHKDAYPSPSLIVLDKHTGKLLARETEGIFDRTFHGANSSPALGMVNGKELLVYGGGNGTCYAFEPDFTPQPDGSPATLKLVWKFDCVADASYGAGFRIERPKRAEVIGTPVIRDNRVYVSIGNDLANSGSKAGPGRLICIDATLSGDITTTGRLWSFDEMRSTASTVAISDGLLYTADAGGVIYCLDAETGQPYWTHSTNPVWASPLVADGKVFVPVHNGGLLVFAHGKEKRLLSHPLGVQDMVSSPAAAHGVLFVATQRHLYALEQGKHGGLVEHEE